jgi:hypothetical protein
MGVSGQRHAPAALYPQEWAPGTRWVGAWMGFRAGLDTETEEISFASAEDRTPVVRHYGSQLTRLIQYVFARKLNNCHSKLVDEWKQVSHYSLT